MLLNEQVNAANTVIYNSQASHWCNLFKGPNLSTLVDGKLTRLFNPRKDNWPDHFAEKEGQILGTTMIGIATVSLLNMNDPDRVELRRLST